jgi:outer membrane protein OmpA-like peptidoglycan-associated protein
MPLLSRRWFAATLLLGLAACAPAMGPSPADIDRIPVYFDEFSADLSPQAIQLVGDAARRARESNARAIRVEGFASATGSAAANKALAQTRTQVVTDELAKLGVPPAIVRQVPIGQTGSQDPGVAERRVDIVLER